MYFDDYEAFIEPSEADAVIDEAVEKIKGLVIAAAKSTLAEAAEAQEKLDGLNHEIYSKGVELNQLEGELEKIKADTEQVTRDMPKKYIKAFVREATGFLAPGDTVWTLRGENKPCERCHGEKKIPVRDLEGNELRVSCPVCNGYGTKYHSKSKVEKKQVREVHLRLSFGENRVNYWNTDCIYLDKDDGATPVKNIFLTEEEAIKAMEENDG